MNVYQYISMLVDRYTHIQINSEIDKRHLRTLFVLHRLVERHARLQVSSHYTAELPLHRLREEHANVWHRRHAAGLTQWKVPGHVRRCLQLYVCFSLH